MAFCCLGSCTMNESDLRFSVLLGVFEELFDTGFAFGEDGVCEADKDGDFGKVAEVGVDEALPILGEF